LTVAMVRFVLRGALGLHGIPIIASAFIVSYASAVLVTAIRPKGLPVLRESRELFRRLWAAKPASSPQP
jgi:hypothetical protein